MTIQEEKAALRRAVRNRERSLTPEYRRESSEAICKKLALLPALREAETVLAFFGTEREIDTEPFLRAVLEMGKTLCLPRCEADRELALCVVRGLETDLEPGVFGIREPKRGCPELRPEDMDFVLVPCLSFDRAGRRLGQGGGYYDRLLPRLACETVCVCREALLSEQVPTEELDQRCKAYLTEKGLLAIS